MAKSKLDGIQAGRGIAACLVVLDHASGLQIAHSHSFPAWDGLFHFAHAGVDFFFVLSGFIIYHIHREDIGRPQQVGFYAWRRFARIFPIYWIVLCLLGALYAYSPPRDPNLLSPGNDIASVFLLPRLQEPILGNAWTLRHELMFYVLFGLLILNRGVGRLVLGAWAAAVIVNLSHTWIVGEPLFGGLLGYLPFRIFNIEFFFGMAVAILVRHYRIPYPRLILLMGIILFFGDGLMESFGPVVPIEWPPRHLGYALGAAMAIYGVVIAEERQLLRVPAFLVILGTASYSIYLTHAMVLWILEYGLRRSGVGDVLSLNLLFPAIIVLAVLPGTVFSYVVELPLLKLLRRPPLLFPAVRAGVR